MRAAWKKEAKRKSEISGSKPDRRCCECKECRGTCQCGCKGEIAECRYRRDGCYYKCAAAAFARGPSVRLWRQGGDTPSFCVLCYLWHGDNWVRGWNEDGCLNGWSFLRGQYDDHCGCCGSEV